MIYSINHLLILPFEYIYIQLKDIFYNDLIIPEFGWKVILIFFYKDKIMFKKHKFGSNSLTMVGENQTQRKGSETISGAPTYSGEIEQPLARAIGSSSPQSRHYLFSIKYGSDHLF